MAPALSSVHSVVANQRSDFILAGKEGFEPSNAGIKTQCFNQLGYSPFFQIEAPSPIVFNIGIFRIENETSSSKLKN